MDAGEAAGDHGEPAEMPRRQRRVLAAAALAVIPVAYDEPADAAAPVVARDRREGLRRLAVEHVAALADLAGERVGRAHEHVVAEAVEMAAVAQPRPGRRDLVGGR